MLSPAGEDAGVPRLPRFCATGTWTWSPASSVWVSQAVAAAGRGLGGGEGFRAATAALGEGPRRGPALLSVQANAEAPQRLAALLLQFLTILLSASLCRPRRPGPPRALIIVPSWKVLWQSQPVCTPSRSPGGSLPTPGATMQTRWAQWPQQHWQIIDASVSLATLPNGLILLSKGKCMTNGCSCHGQAEGRLPLPRTEGHLLGVHTAGRGNAPSPPRTCSRAPRSSLAPRQTAAGRAAGAGKAASPLQGSSCRGVLRGSKGELDLSWQPTSSAGRHAGRGTTGPTTAG